MILSILIQFLWSLIGVAEAAGAGHGDGIPTVVYYQFLNFGLFLLIMYVLLRKKLRLYFASREASFRQAQVKAQEAFKAAEDQKREIQERLSALVTSADESVARARSEAEVLRQQILEEARGLSDRLKEEAQKTAHFEAGRAKMELREELLSQAVTAAKKVLSEKIAEPDQRRLQTEFVEKIQVVS